MMITGYHRVSKSLGVFDGFRMVDSDGFTGISLNFLGNHVNHSTQLLPSQRHLEALALAQVTPQQLQLVECHGTGTALGDPIETGALKATLAEGSDESDGVGCDVFFFDWGVFCSF